MDLKELGKEILSITGVLAIVAVIAVFSSGNDLGFLGDLAHEWLAWVGVLVAIAVVFGGWRLLRRR